jgi:hypothetical protein
MDEEYDPSNSAIEGLDSILEISNTTRHKVAQDTTWWTYPPLFNGALDVVNESKTLYRSEIEVRLGKFAHDGTFVSGVSEQFFFDKIQMLASAPVGTFVESYQWARMVEYIYPDDARIRVPENEFARFMKKSTVRNFNVPLDGAPYDFRVSLKTEHDAQIAPAIPEMVRIKERKSFNYRNIMVYDFTKVWSGRHVRDAMGQPPLYEIEIECLDQRPDPDYITKSLFMKVTDLLLDVKTARRKRQNRGASKRVKRIQTERPREHYAPLSLDAPPQVFPPGSPCYSPPKSPCYSPPKSPQYAPPIVDENFLRGINYLYNTVINKG